MKIAMLRGPRDLHIEEHELDTSNLEPHDLWIKTEISALKIGTDRGNYEGAERVPGAPDYPRPVGDSNLGVVQGVGDAVKRFQAGDRVVTQQTHQSEYIIRDAPNIVKVPDGVHPEDAVYTHLYNLSSLCYRKAYFQPGENVAVVGLGVLGLGAVALGQVFGARVIGIGNSAVRLEMAEGMGAHTAFMYDDPMLGEKLNSLTNGVGVDLVILTANPWPAFRTSLKIVRPNGRVSIVSLLGRGEPPLDFNPLAMELFYSKGISIIAVSGAAGNLYPATNPNTPYAAQDAYDRFAVEQSAGYVLSLMEDGRLEPKRLVTHRFHYTEIAKAYEMIYRREKSMLGVIFDWDD